MDLNDLMNIYFPQWRTQGTQNRNQYMRPGLELKADPNTNAAGYHRLLEPNILYLNPNRLRDQHGGLETLFHEAAHADQGLGMRMLQGAFTTPGWLTKSVTDFPYYDETDSNPNVLEKLATMRADKAMAPPSQDWFDRTIGKDVLDQARKKYGYPTNRAGYTDEQLKKILMREMFPDKSIQPDADTGSWFRALLNMFKQ